MAAMGAAVDMGLHSDKKQQLEAWKLIRTDALKRWSEANEKVRALENDLNASNEDVDEASNLLVRARKAAKRLKELRV